MEVRVRCEDLAEGHVDRTCGSQLNELKIFNLTLYSLHATSRPPSLSILPHSIRSDTLGRLKASVSDAAWNLAPCCLTRTSFTPSAMEDTTHTLCFDPHNLSCAQSRSTETVDNSASCFEYQLSFKSFLTTHIFKITAATRKGAQCFGNRVYVRRTMPLSPLISGILSFSEVGVEYSNHAPHLLLFWPLLLHRSSRDCNTVAWYTHSRSSDSLAPSSSAIFLQRVP